MKSVIPIFLVSMLIAGCALEEKGQWVKPVVTETEWKKDNYECTRDATYYEERVPYGPYYWGYRWSRVPHYPSTWSRLDPYLYAMCLEARGYQWRPER